MTVDRPMMKCGHAANAVDQDGKPCCVICVGITDGAREVADSPDLSARVARCTYYGKEPAGYRGPCDTRTRDDPTCRCETPSEGKEIEGKTWRPWFFEHVPAEPYDRYYCGCWGTD